MFFFLQTRREYELRPREHVVSERPPPAIRRARAARPRESVPRAPPGRPPRVHGSRPRASSRVPRVTDHPNVRIPRDYARAEDLRRRDHGAGPRAGEAGASRRHARALVFRAPPRLASRARARPRRAARPPPDRVVDAFRTRLERSWSLGTSWRAESGASFFRDQRGIRVETRGRASRRASVFRHASRRDLDPRSIRRTRRDTRGHRLTPTTSVAPPPTRDAREKKITQRFFSETWAPASRAWCFAS